MTETTTSYRICPICEASCGLKIETTGRTVGDIRGNDNDVLSRGFICPKGVAIRELDSDPDRLRTPLVRRGGELVEATWDEAFSEIEKKLSPIIAEHGRTSIAGFIGNPTAHKASLQLYMTFLFKALATKHVYSASTLDQMPRQLASGLMYGNMSTVPVPDIDRANMLVIIGGNPMASNGSLWTVPDFRGRVREMKKRGARLVVIDPKKSETAKLADQHIAVRPGTDAFLLAAVAHTLLKEGLANLGEIEQFVSRLSEFADVIEDFSPEAVSDITGVSPETTRQLARDIAATRAAVYSRMGACTQEFGTLSSWLTDVLCILVGSLDRVGGAMFPKGAALQGNATGKPRTGRGVSIGRWQSRVRGATEIFGELPAVCLAEEIETPGPDQIRALFTIASNPVLSTPNGERIGRALGSLDFMVSIDIYLNETTRHADVILPGTSPFEEPHFGLASPQFSVRNTVRYSPAIFPFNGTRPSEWEIVLRLAAIVSGEKTTPQEMDEQIIRGRIRAQVGKEFSPVFERDEGEIYEKLFGTGPERQIDLALRVGPYGDAFGENPDGVTLQKLIDTPDGIDLGPLEPRMPDVLRTPSGNIELAPPELLSDVERLREALGRATPSSFLLIGRRHIRTNNSWMHNLPLLAKGPAKCTMQIHPDDADRLGLEDGAMASVKGTNGSVEVVTERTDDIMPGVISIPHGFGHNQQGANLRVASERPGVNSNVLADDSKIDPLSGTAILNGIPVSVSVA